MLGFHPIYLVILVIIVLIIFGPGRLPELGGAIGKGLREFRKATSDLTDQITKAPEEKPAPPAATATPAAHTATPTPAEPVKPVEPESKA